ncbi:hypothetical protein ACHAWF_007454 [Thalassiosira exigua]
MTMSSSSSSAPTHEVHLAIYDLSMGMARSLSSQFLGPQHAVEIIPHTAIIAYGKEYYFGQGIEWCTPHEFRATRGIHPIELQPLGRTACTEREFEEWCRARAADGTFGPTSYDFFHKNCNNFSEEAARRGLRLARGVPRWILDLPQKFLSSPMGVAVRPLLEQMQITNIAPTNAPRGGSRGATMPPAFAPAPAAAAAHAANPWANIPAAASATTPQPQSASTVPEKSTGCKPATPLLDKQTALLSTDTGVVKTCVDRLKPEEERTRKLLSKLADANASWTRDELDTVHRYLRPVVEGDARRASFALMLLRLAVLRRPSGEVGRSEEPSRSAQLVAHSLIDGEATSPASRSVAWCALSNAAGSADPPDWNVSSHTGCYNLVQVVDRALGDCDPSADGAASSGSHASLRRSAAAFLYNASRLLAEDDGGGGDAGPDLLSEGAMSVLLGCLERLREETDVEASRRLYMAVGQLLKSSKSGAAARSLVQDLDLFDDEMSKGKNKEVEGLAGEVASLLR